MISSSIVICTRNRLEDIVRALRSIQRQTLFFNVGQEDKVELIIVDSSDESLKFSDAFKNIFNEKKFPGIILKYIHTSPGLTKQRNEGIALAESDIIYFFDDDVKLEDSYLEEMNKVFISNPRYGGGMGSVINIGPPASKKYDFFRKFFLLQRDYADGIFSWSGMPTHAYGRKDFKEVEVLGGCCFAFRTDLLKKHLFDEKLRYYSYMEDCDISKRIGDHSTFFFNPSAKLSHYHSPVARDKVVENRAMYIKNYSYLFFKNFYPQNKLRVIGYAWSVMGLFLEAILLWRFDEIKGYSRGLREFVSGTNSPR